MSELHRDIVVVGASAGGVRALLELVKAIPADLPMSIVVAVHMSATVRSELPALLTAHGPLPAAHALDNQTIEPGHIYVAPPDHHVIVRSGHLHVHRGPRENGHRPSVDLLFRSAAAAYGPRVIGIVLSGHLDCGTAGLLSIKARAGLALVQDPTEATAPSMPKSALAHVEVDRVLRVAEMGPTIARLAREQREALHVQPNQATLALEGEVLGAPTFLVCPSCQGVLTESQVNGFQSFRCHVGHSFSLARLVLDQADSLERALWAGVRALDESAALAERLGGRALGDMRERFTEKTREQRAQANVLRSIIASAMRLVPTDSASVPEERRK